MPPLSRFEKSFLRFYYADEIRIKIYPTLKENDKILRTTVYVGVDIYAKEQDIPWSEQHPLGWKQQTKDVTIIPAVTIYPSYSDDRNLSNNYLLRSVRFKCIRDRFIELLQIVIDRK